MKIYLVTLRETCEECEGEGTWPNQEWDAFNNEFDRVHAAVMADPNSEEEYPNPKKWFLCDLHLAKVPPTDIVCARCQGKRFVEKESNLLGALCDLGYLPPGKETGA